MKRSYDFLARFYDLLVALVFGRSLDKAANYFLDDRFISSRILILGGGTGRILNRLNSEGYEGEIVYVDSSSGMINKARRRAGKLHVVFVQEDIFSFESEIKFDLIHMAFFLDQFNSYSINLILSKVRNWSKAKTSLIITDFRMDFGGLYAVLLKAMYLFFRMMTKIEANRLQEWELELKELGFQLQDEKMNYFNKVRAAIYSYTG